MGHAKPSTTETVYAHLLADDHADAMAGLGAMSRQLPGRATSYRCGGLGARWIRKRLASLRRYDDCHPRGERRKRINPSSAVITGQSQYRAPEF